MIANLLRIDPLFDPLTNGVVISEEDFVMFRLCDFYGCEWEEMSASRIPNLHKEETLWEHFAVRKFSKYLDWCDGIGRGKKAT